MITGSRTSRSIDYKGAMTLYELLLFIHISATVVWVGAGLCSLILAMGYDRDGDEPAIRRFLADQERLATRLFIPASLTVVIFGIALVIESDAWSFDYLWITLGLIGFAATFVTGLFMIKPASERIGAAMEREGGRLTPALRTDIRKLIVLSRLDYVVLFLVIGDMVVKPTGDDVAVLIGMALIALAGVAYIVMGLRALDARQAAPASA
jgi:uncharacterized membrane protein